jgi:hypothetical protein
MIENFKGYKFLLGAEQLRLDDLKRVDSPEDYRLWQLWIVTSRGAEPWDSEASVEAYVNHGRWVANCYWCRTGMYTRPDWGVAFCAECGARYGWEKVLFPKEYEEIAHLLCRRVRREQQNWDRTQDIESLRAECRVLEEAGDAIPT